MKALLLFNAIDLPEANMIRGLASSGVEIHLMCNPNAHNLPLVEEHVDRIFPLVCRNKLDFKAIKTVSNQLKAERYDVVHTFLSRILAVTIISILYSGYKAPLIAYRGVTGRINRLNPLSWISYLSPRINQIVCVSDDVKSDLALSGIPETKLRRIYKGHDPSWYDVPKLGTRAELGVPEEAFVVGCVANMRRKKGADVLLKTALKLANHTDIHYVLIGEVRHKVVLDLADQFEIKKQVHLAGKIIPATRFSRCFDVFVLPTRSGEGLSKSLLEAMAQGVAPIATDVGGVREIIRDGIDGIIVPPNDPTAISEAIWKLYLNPDLREQLGKNAKQRVEKTFYPQQTADETLSMYCDLVKTPFEWKAPTQAISYVQHH